MKYIFLFLLVLLVDTHVSAQQKYVVSGLVIDNENSQPLQFVNVVLLQPSDSSIVTGIITNEAGAFQMKQVAKGTYLIRFKFLGYNELYRSLNVQGNEKLVELGVIELEPSSIKTGEVLIEVETKMIETSIDKRVFNVDQDLSSRGGTAEDVLQNVPSIEVDQDGNISLRGNTNVIILIDGRPSTLSGGSRGALLNGIPAESIERIEVVTNPSAKYDPDGMTGIINIVLKKNKFRGVNGNLTLTRGTGNSNSGALGLNYRTSKVNVFMNYSHNDTEGYRNFYSYRVRDLSDDTEDFDQNRLGKDLRTSNTLKIGADYNISERQVWGLSLTYGDNDRARFGLQSNERETLAQGKELWYRNSVENTISTSWDLNSNYQLRFKENKGELYFDVNHSRSNGRMFADYDEYAFSGSNNGLYVRETLDNPEASNISTIALDVLSKFGKNMQFEYGLKGIINTNNRTQYREIFDFDQALFSPDININNEFKLSEQIYSAYGIFAQKRKKIHYQVGLRLEQAFVRPELVTTNEKFTNDYFSFFPSVHLVLPIVENKKDVFLSYSRRISRPGMGSLNPFVEFTDPFNFRFGNPNLRPEYTNSFEAGYNHEMKNISFNNTLYYRHSYDVLQRILVFDSLGRGAVTWDNLDQTINWGYEGIVTYKPTKWWRNVLSVNVYQLYLITSNPLLRNNSGINWNAKITTSFDLWNKSAALQINGRYTAPRIVPQGFVIPGPAVDVSFQKSFLERKLNLTLRVSDIFDTQGFFIQTEVPGVFQEREFKWETRRFFITLNYNFGRVQKAKEPRRRPPNSGGGGEDMM